MSTTEQKDLIKSYSEQLLKELRNGGSENFKKYLRFSQTFTNYSFNNQILIFSQMPHATQVASYNKWQKLNRQVKRGAKSIKIFAPIIGKDKNAKSDEDKKVFFGFKAMSVFDVSQTEGEAIPTWNIRPNDQRNDQGLYLQLKKQAESLGATVIEKDMGVLGMTDGKTIWIDPSQTSVDKFLTLIHELAHYLLHFGEDRISLSKGEKECQAEAAAYIVSAHYGLETVISAEYLLSWGNNEERLMKSLSKTIEASKIILKMLGNEQSESQDSITETVIQQAA